MIIYKWRKEGHFGGQVDVKDVAERTCGDATSGNMRTYLVLRSWATCRFQHTVFHLQNAVWIMLSGLLDWLAQT